MLKTAYSGHPVFSSSGVVSPEAGGEHSGGDRMAFIIDDSRLRSSSTALILCCLTKAETGAINPSSIKIFSSKVCLKLSNRDQCLKLWLSISSRITQGIISVTTLSTNEKKKSLLSSVAVQYSVVKTSPQSTVHVWYLPQSFGSRFSSPLVGRSHQQTLLLL